MVEFVDGVTRLDRMKASDDVKVRVRYTLYGAFEGRFFRLEQPIINDAFCSYMYMY